MTVSNTDICTLPSGKFTKPDNHDNGLGDKAKSLFITRCRIVIKQQLSGDNAVDVSWCQLSIIHTSCPNLLTQSSYKPSIITKKYWAIYLLIRGVVIHWVMSVCVPNNTEVNKKYYWMLLWLTGCKAQMLIGRDKTEQPIPVCCTVRSTLTTFFLPKSPSGHSAAE